MREMGISQGGLSSSHLKDARIGDHEGDEDPTLLRKKRVEASLTLRGRVLSFGHPSPSSTTELDKTEYTGGKLGSGAYPSSKVRL
jgi:hypothetical protein